MNIPQADKMIWTVENSQTFRVEIVRWCAFSADVAQKMRTEYEFLGGRFRWNVYAYVYPKHRDFTVLCGVSRDTFLEMLGAYPLHAGATFFQKHWCDNGKSITSVQFGSDYNHYGDEVYSREHDLHNVPGVWNDAMELVEHLKGAK